MDHNGMCIAIFHRVGSPVLPSAVHPCVPVRVLCANATARALVGMFLSVQQGTSFSIQWHPPSCYTATECMLTDMLSWWHAGPFCAGNISPSSADEILARF